MTTSSGTDFCVNHPNVETMLRCNKCGDPICARCATLTPVGYRCKKCIRQQQAVFYTGMPVDYLIAALITLPLSAAGAYLASLLGIFLTFFVSPVVGGVTADVVWRAVGRRRSRYLWVVVSGAIVIATAGVALYQAGAFSGYVLSSHNLLRIELALYLVLAASAAYSRLRWG